VDILTRTYAVTGVTVASSGTHTRWCRKQASSLALSNAPDAAGRASSLALWRSHNGMCRYRRGAAEIPAGVSVTYAPEAPGGETRVRAKYQYQYQYICLHIDSHTIYMQRGHEHTRRRNIYIDIDRYIHNEV